MRISDWSSDVCSSDLISDKSFSLGPNAFILPPARCRTWPTEDNIDRRCATSRTMPPRPRTASTARASAASPSGRSEEHTSELQSLMRISYAVFCLKTKNTHSTETQSSDDHIKPYAHKQHRQRH